MTMATSATLLSTRIKEGRATEREVRLADIAPQLLESCKDLLKVVDALMPGVRHIAVQDYQALNEVPVIATRAVSWVEDSPPTASMPGSSIHYVPDDIRMKTFSPGNKKIVCGDYVWQRGVWTLAENLDTGYDIDDAKIIVEHLRTKGIFPRE